MSARRADFHEICLAGRHRPPAHRKCNIAMPAVVPCFCVWPHAGPLLLGPGRHVGLKPLSPSLQHVRDVQHRLSAPTAFQKAPGLSSLEILAEGLLPPMHCTKATRSSLVLLMAPSFQPLNAVPLHARGRKHRLQQASCSSKYRAARLNADPCLGL